MFSGFCFRVPTPTYTYTYSQVQLIVGGKVVTASGTVRDLGVTVDAQLTMKNHADGVARSCFYQLRQLRSIHPSLLADDLHTLVHAFDLKWNRLLQRCPVRGH